MLLQTSRIIDLIFTIIALTGSCVGTVFAAVINVSTKNLSLGIYAILVLVLIIFIFLFFINLNFNNF